MSDPSPVTKVFLLTLPNTFGTALRFQRSAKRFPRKQHITLLKQKSNSFQAM